MSAIAKELGLIIPERRRNTAVYGDSRAFGMYEFSDGTVCHVVNDPLSDQNLVAIDSQLGRPVPTELDMQRIAKFSEHQGHLKLENLVRPI